VSKIHRRIPYHIQVAVNHGNLRADLGQELRRCRVKAQMTQAEVARLAGTTQQLIARIECGLNPSVSLKMLARVAAACGAKARIRFVKD